MKRGYIKIHLTADEYEVIAEKLGKLTKKPARYVSVNKLYKRDEKLNSLLFARVAFKVSDEVESVLLTPTDAPPDTPAYIVSKKRIEKPIEYILEKIEENKIVPICDEYECSYVIFT